MRAELVNWWWFSLLIAIVILFCVLITVLIDFYNAHLKGTTLTKPADVIRVPVNNIFTLLGILLPLIGGLFGYLLTKHPTQEYTYVFTAIVVLMLLAMIATMLNFSLLGREREDNTFDIRWPKDRFLVILLSLMPILLFFGITYLCLFFLVEFQPTPDQSNDSSPLHIQIGNSEEEIIQAWGNPTSVLSGDEPAYIYDGPSKRVILYFDLKGCLTKFVVTKKD
jgi:MFS family permease